MRKITLSIFIVFLFQGLTCFSQDKDSNELPQSAKLFVKLPDYCPTPDAFDIAPDGSLTLSCPNYVDKTKHGVLVRISNDGEVTKLGELPGLSAGKKAVPTGIAYGADGSLYVCDNQGPNKSRVLRVTFENNNVKNVEVVAEGMSSPNGIRYYNGAVYVTQPKLPKFKTEKLTSGVYRFLETDRNIKVNNDSSDVQLIFHAQTQNPDRQFGLDGIVFDKKGRLLVSDFGDGTIYQLTLSKRGEVLKKKLYAKVSNKSGIDGMYFDDKGNLYLAGFSLNQVIKIDKKKRVSVLAQYPDNNGANGELDQPADLIVYNGKLIISNFDLMVQKGMVNKKHSAPFTISSIALDD